MHPFSSPPTVTVTKVPAGWASAGGSASTSGSRGDLAPARPARIDASAISSSRARPEPVSVMAGALTDDKGSIPNHPVSVAGRVAGRAEVDQLNIELALLRRGQ